jgi:hypothetical protein
MAFQDFKQEFERRDFDFTETEKVLLSVAWEASRIAALKDAVNEVFETFGKDPKCVDLIRKLIELA